MLMNSSSQPLSEQELGVRRITLFVFVQGIATLLIVLFIVLTGQSHEVFSAAVVGVCNLVILSITYALRRSLYAEWVIYANLAITVGLIAASGPLSGRIDGSVWSIFQIPPLVATIVLNRPRSTLIVVLISALLLTSTVLLEFAGILPVEFVVPKPTLIVNLGCQLIVLAVIAITIRVLVARAQAALAAAQQTRQQIETQLGRERALLAQQEQANAELATSLAALRQRDERIAHAQAEQGRLRTLISELTTPVLPVWPGVVIMPLIGGLDGERSRQITQMLLAGIERYRAQVAILDVTGLPTIDTAIGAMLIQAAEACRMLGATPVLAGINPEVAQTLVTLGIDLGTLVSVSDLQSGVAYAIQHNRRAEQSALLL